MNVTHTHMRVVVPFQLYFLLVFCIFECVKLDCAHLWIRLSMIVTHTGGVNKDGFVMNALRELSIGLCRGNAMLYKRSLPVMARVSGTSFRSGMLVPTGEIP